MKHQNTKKLNILFHCSHTKTFCEKTFKLIGLVAEELGVWGRCPL